MLIKRYGFTLGEILLAVLIVGIVAVLTLPSLIKDTTQKARMALLKSTIGSISNAVQAEFIKLRTNEITDTLIYKDPKTFLETFDIAKSGTPFADSYKKLSDSQTATDIIIPSNSETGQGAYLLKSGLGLGLVNDTDLSLTYVVVDLTGEEKPNIVGTDYFVFKIDWNDDIAKNERVGEISSFKNGGETGDETISGLKTSCQEGNGASCFRLVELSGFDPKYLDYTPKDSSDSEE